MYIYVLLVLVVLAIFTLASLLIGLEKDNPQFLLTDILRGKKKEIFLTFSFEVEEKRRIMTVTLELKCKVVNAVLQHMQINTYAILLYWERVFQKCSCFAINVIRIFVL